MRSWLHPTAVPILRRYRASISSQAFLPCPERRTIPSVGEFVTYSSTIAYGMKPTQPIGYLISNRGTEREKR